MHGVQVNMECADVINGVYEALAGVFLGLNCLTLYRDKKVRGVSVIATAFFSSWSWWNLYYYPNLNQWASFVGGLVVVWFNTLYIVMMVYYIRKEKC